MEISELKDILEKATQKLDELERLIDVKHLQSEIKQLEDKTYEGAFWDDHKAASKTIERLKILKQKVKHFTDLHEKIEDLHLALELLEMGESVDTLDKEVDQLHKQFDKLETTLYLSETYDHFNAIVEIHPGAGGTESQDWAMMLYRMMQRYAEREGYAMDVNDYQEALEAGLKSVTFTVFGDFAYGMLKSESGVHRLVRISPFDSSGRRHTSFASINIIPEIDDSIEIELNENDLKIDTYRSSGAGGQSVNTTDSAVRITHLPTKLVVTCQNERSQFKNRDRAMKILKGKLYQLELQKKQEELSKMRSNHKGIDFGSQIRSYVMHPYSMVKDHRTDVETGNVQKVLDGDLTLFITAYLKTRAKGDHADASEKTKKNGV